VNDEDPGSTLKEGTPEEKSFPGSCLLEYNGLTYKIQLSKEDMWYETETAS